MKKYKFLIVYEADGYVDILAKDLDQASTIYFQNQKYYDEQVKLDACKQLMDGTSHILNSVFTDENGSWLTD